jgi:DNA polymerase-3 subunit delta'
MARAPRAGTVEPVPAEPDLLDNVPLPRETPFLYGHDGVTARLADAFSAKPPQALLLEGPRGVGKATLAFRLAKALSAGAPLATDLATDPEGRAARQIAAGTHPSVLHLTRPWDFEKKRFKTELTVDEVRRIVPFLGSTAAGDGWRIVVVDAVDDLNQSAANALLKSLEEPPRRTLFLLLAHVAGRVMPTIRSRTQAIRLRPLGEADMVAALGALGIDPGLGEAGQGSVRRAAVLAAAGADDVRAAMRLLRPAAVRDLRSHHDIAEIAAKKGGPFEVVLDLILDALGERARAAAGRVPLAALEGYAGAFLDAAAERRRVEAFNLDKRETVLALMARLAAADRASERASEPPGDRPGAPPARG